MKAAALAALATLLLPAGAAARPVSISATTGHTCSAMSDGSVTCWGKSYLPVMQSKVPEPFGGFSEAIDVQSSTRYNCVLLRSGAVSCWGDDGFGQLGDGLTEDNPVPGRVLGVTSAKAIAAGTTHACALLSSGKIECWGANRRGQIGNGSSGAPVLTPATVSLPRASAISAGYNDTCAVAAGRVYCWGADQNGQLGNGTVSTRASPSPTLVSGLRGAVGVSMADEHACALLASGAVYCWGSNEYGALGDATRLQRTHPVRVRRLAHARAISAASHGYTCAVVRGGRVYCWGRNAKDYLGNGRQPRPSALPVRAIGITNATSISTGMGHACSLLSSGGAKCWGYDDYGQLGNGAGLPLIRNPNPVRY